LSQIYHGRVIIEQVAVSTDFFISVLHIVSCWYRTRFVGHTLYVSLLWSQLFTAVLTLLCPARRGGGNKRCFCPYVCLSVRPSHTWRIIREPKGLACPNLEGRFPTLDATRIPVSRSNGQRSGLEADGAILCRPNLAATLLVTLLSANCQKTSVLEHFGILKLDEILNY